jgi:ribosomal protein S18 acetylase RimI-like enzyme
MLAIRRYEPSDHDAVWELHEIALRAANADAGDGPWDDDLDRIEEVYLNSGGGEFLVGVVEGRVVAMGAVRRSSEFYGKIRRMRVHPDYQRRGFGQAILTALEQHANEVGYRVLHLDTTTLQEAARHLYTKNGYVEVGRRHAYGFELIFYEKKLVSN